MSTLVTVAVVAAIVGSALIGGIFFAFSNFIMKALAQVPSSQGVSAMQSINVTVLNRWFLGAFMGTALVCLFLAVIAIADCRMAPSPYLLGGAVAYVAGTWLVTVGGNVPLNHRLAELAPDDPASSDLWDHYLDRWTTLNSRRAGSALCAAVLFCIGLIVSG
jgi:uncharacterized membrane protein